MFPSFVHFLGPGAVMRFLARVLVVGIAIVMFSSPLLAEDPHLDRGRMHDMLNVVAKDIEKYFYDPGLKGLDWKALTAAAHEKINSAKTNGDMLTAIFSLVDKLQDSHTQFDPPSRVSHPLYGFFAKPFGDEVRIYRIKARSAAEQAGLKVGDRIVSINGFRAERGSFDLMMLYYRRLRPASALKIVYQHGSEEPQTIMLAAKIKAEQVVLDFKTEENIWNYIDENYEERRPDHTALLEAGIAYVEVADFGTEEIGSIHQVDKKSAKAVIVDLRGDPGGYQQTILELAGHFEPQPTSMGEAVSRKKTEQLKIKPQKPNFEAPLVILVDSRSASAAEMFARHFQRTGRAVLVGDRSSGRVNSSLYYSEHLGTERVVPFGVQIAVAKIVLTGGEELENRGVTPDVLCVPTGDDLAQHRDPCLREAVKVARRKLQMPDELSPAAVAQVDSLARQLAAEHQKALDTAKD
jgi:carboxyl-terminal processing protease